MDGQGVLRRAIFLDRDGTLNKDTGYVHRKEDWHWLPGVVEALKRFHAVGYALVVVSNQSGLARGMYDLAALHELEAWINADLEAKGAAIDAWYYCPHLPEITGPCSCRKPAPGLILRAAEEMGLDLARSWMVGDRVREVDAGLAAGCRCVLLRPAQGGYEADAPVPPGVAVAPHLAAAEVLILGPELRRLRTEREIRSGRLKGVG
ncbi:D-glycero-beta-D-manno-heptose 1,7-bisphosphate 7-phosphatase [uncultured Desulfovibrio sp.]|uniref:D-glycero-beta-D-manno-heptose 1,7-bisphosphate 7-phosphatase n=1 Tax=uncultured Desulfovibrio sp. TaxID=167968 RepID=UPI00266EDE05|nr:D-glycero-beta-D-manno-heptose 1,7-bisphosphate 7-phosphatase [uncultured Desulfovibrio sp.]